ncbi:MAG: hypothetical protein ACRCZB_08360, partial [Bacteroidales bacterium]
SIALLRKKYEDVRCNTIQQGDEYITQCDSSIICEVSNDVATLHLSHLTPDSLKVDIWWQGNLQDCSVLDFMTYTIFNGANSINQEFKYNNMNVSVSAITKGHYQSGGLMYYKMKMLKCNPSAAAYRYTLYQMNYECSLISAP